MIPSIGVLASRYRKVRTTEFDPVVTLEFDEISNRGRKLPPEAIEFDAFSKNTHSTPVSVIGGEDLQIPTCPAESVSQLRITGANDASI